jgi:hypothetical protein
MEAPAETFEPAPSVTEVEAPEALGDEPLDTTTDHVADLLEEIVLTAPADLVTDDTHAVEVVLEQPPEVAEPEAPTPEESEQSEAELADTEREGWKRGVDLHATERVRKLSAPDRRKLARTGNQQERNALERAYGKAVWEALLANPKISSAEVAAIARKGSVPIPLIEKIVGHAAWLAASVVRRALLTNPRLRGSMIDKVLRATPKSELKLIPRQGSYTPAVRAVASRMLKR